MKNNYERDKTVDPCNDCINKMNWEACKTCKHRKKFTQGSATVMAPHIQPSLFQRLGFNSTIK